MAGRRLTTEEFIERARKVHGDKYNYSKVEYVNNYSKVKIICPIHGEFQQVPSGHLSGSGCRECAKIILSRKNSFSLDKIIQQFKNIHGDKYDYSKVKYKNDYTKVIIICPIHGKFKQNPGVHKQGSGCPKCTGRGLCTEEFIKRAKEIHGSKYDYSKVNYINDSTKVTIICPIHGEFQQCNSHLRGAGCPKCAHSRISNSLSYNNGDFIKKAKEIYGDEYDYSNIEYVDSYTRVKIIHNKCGYEFLKSPGNHLNGQGCPKCSGKLRPSTEEFIEICNKVHNFKYDYSKTMYIKEEIKICIICPIHGEFWQGPGAHKHGQGCPRCSTSKGELKIQQYLEENNIKYESQKRFSECKNIRPLPFDFYLPDYNLCIEYDGEQHFKLERIDFTGKMNFYEKNKAFNQQKKHDKIKNKFCEENNIDLLRIPYTKFNDIEIILKKLSYKESKSWVFSS